MTTITAYVTSLERTSRLSDRVRVTALYEAGNIHGSITFDVPIAAARDYVIGQRLTISIAPEAT